MALRSVASLSLSFGLVSIPVKVYTATESSAAIQFKLRARGGGRVRQQYVTEPETFVEDLSPPPPPPTRTSAPSRSAGLAAGRAEAQAETKAQAEMNLTPTPGRGQAPTPPPVAASVPPIPSRAMPSRPEPLPWQATSAERSSAPAPTIVERSDMVKGYEFEPGQFVLFEADELKALAEAARQTIDIVAFLPEHSVDPIYYDKAYFLAPDKRGGKPYALLRKAMRESGRCALAKWAWRSKQYMVQIRPAEGGLVLQQLLYADEVRSIDDLGIDLVEVGAAELELAIRLIEQISVDRYDPSQYVDEEKERILAAVREKIAGRQIVVEHAPEPRTLPSAQVIDLVAALRASLGATKPAGEQGASGAAAKAGTARERKPVRRAGKTGAESAGKADATADRRADARADGRAGVKPERKASSGKR